MMGFHNTLTRAALGILLCAAPVLAAPSSDKLVEGARLCTQHFPVQERAQGIPNHLLAAISSTESGRWHNGLGMALPWPWTINVEGKGYYFDSKAEAMARTAEFIRQGATSIDVGCMQVNLKHHNTAFRNLDEAFDPGTNVAYAAKFLRTNYNDLGDWIKATAAYHSRTPKYGSAYLARIEKSWNSIVTKVAAARANQGLAPQSEMQAKFELPNQPAQPAHAMNRIDSTRGVKVIQVTQQDRRASDVMVVHREVNATPIRIADARATNADAMPQPDMMVKTQAGVKVKSLGVDSAAPAANSANTKFVFAN